MKAIKEIYPDEVKESEEDEEHYFFEISNYQPMLYEFGEIILQVDDNDWQGDSRLLYKNNNRYGYLQFGWGSCSGCDALQGCESFEEIQNLMNRLYESILWFDTKEECLNYFKTHDWEGDYSWADEDGKQNEFIQKSMEILS